MAKLPGFTFRCQSKSSKLLPARRSFFLFCHDIGLPSGRESSFQVFEKPFLSRVMAFLFLGTRLSLNFQGNEYNPFQGAVSNFFEESELTTFSSLLYPHT